MMLLYSVLLLTIGFTAITFVDAPYPNELWLQHIPTAVFLIVMAIVIPRRPLSTASMLCLFAFVWLHAVGARWIYSFVPYDRWSESVFGFTLSEQFGWTRNHYDRMVHFASGMLFVPPAAEWLCRWAPMRPAAAALLSITVVMAIGAAYEIVEWMVAVTFSPRHAEAYNGQQGDVWDPQKDMALAGLGAIIAAWLVRRRAWGLS